MSKQTNQPVFRPNSVAELQEVVGSHHRLLPRGGGTKSALSQHAAADAIVDMRGLNGIIDYQPDEYTFTAYAGTPTAEIAATLKRHQQFMPFDPLFMDRGSTIGGCLAANTSGPGRYRYGGVRDFILGVRWVDGWGQLVRGGGKVVKNSAGFDIPKFMVGSMGRYGILTELTFKVFPQPRVYVDLYGSCSSLAKVLIGLGRLATQPLEMDELNFEPNYDGTYTLHISLGGTADALAPRIERLQAFLKSNDICTSFRSGGARELTASPFKQQMLSAGAECMIKLPLVANDIPQLEAQLNQIYQNQKCVQWQYTTAGNVAWIQCNKTNLSAIESQISKQGLQAQLIVDPNESSSRSAYLGNRKGAALAHRVKQALDPDGRFLADQ